VIHDTSVARGCPLRGSNGSALAKAVVDTGGGNWLHAGKG